jgi:hypothetical protein
VVGLRTRPIACHASSRCAVEVQGEARLGSTEEAAGSIPADRFRVAPADPTVEQQVGRSAREGVAAQHDVAQKRVTGWSSDGRGLENAEARGGDSFRIALHCPTVAFHEPVERSNGGA